jgi:hypothetical protein
MRYFTTGIYKQGNKPCVVRDPKGITDATNERTLVPVYRPDGYLEFVPFDKFQRDFEFVGEQMPQFSVERGAWKNNKNGETYFVIDQGLLDEKPAVRYMNATGECFARLIDEFKDKFTKV